MILFGQKTFKISGSFGFEIRNSISFNKINDLRKRRFLPQ